MEHKTVCRPPFTVHLIEVTGTHDYEILQILI